MRGYLRMRYEPCSDWHDSTIDDAKAIAALMGWQIDNVYYSGFSSQGDGACFTGRMGYAKGCATAVKSYAPADTTLHRIAERWQELQRRCFYSIECKVTHSGRYYHEYCTEFETLIGSARDWYSDFPDDKAEECKDIARDFMRWIYRALEREYDYQAAWALAQGWQDQAEVMANSRKEARQLVQAMRAAIKAGMDSPAIICIALRKQLRGYLDTWERARQEREAIAGNFHYWQDDKSLSIAEFTSANF